MIACSEPQADREARERALTIGRWRDYLEDGLRGRGISYVPSAAPYVLTRLGAGARAALRSHGIAVRRADTFPGLDASWARIAVRPQPVTARLFAALDEVRPS
jgi:cobyrinic acid a,c-diamide synthase